MNSYRRKDNECTRKWKHIISIASSAKDRNLQMLNEMAISLKLFIERIEGIQFELIENWCLCKWCQLYDPTNEKFDHWKDELYACMIYLHRPLLKGKIKKKKHLKKILIDDYDFNDKTQVSYAIADKFNEENIIDINQRNNVALQFANNVDNIIDLIDDNSLSLKAYIHSTFKTH